MVRVSLSDALPLVTSRFTVTLPEACGTPRFSVAFAAMGLVMLYSPGFSESTVQLYARLLPVEPLPLSWIEPDPVNVVTFGLSAMLAVTVGGLPENCASMQPWNRSKVH